MMDTELPISSAIIGRDQNINPKGLTPNMTPNMLK